MAAMEGEELASLARSAYEAYKDGDEDRLSELLSEDVVWHALEGGGSFQDFEGIKQVMEYTSKMLRQARIQGSFDIELGDVHAQGRYAVGFHTARAEREGASLTDREVLIGRGEEGRLVEVWQFFEDPAATREFWG